MPAPTCPIHRTPLKYHPTGRTGPWWSCVRKTTDNQWCSMKRDATPEEQAEQSGAPPAQAAPGSGPQAAPPQSRALAPLSHALIQKEMAAPLAEASRFNAFVAAVQANGDVNLVTPATSLAVVPPFHAVSITQVKADVNNPAEVYDVGGGKKALGKPVLDRIAAAAGVRWTRSERTDDRSSPWYVEWTAECAYRALDGRMLTSIGSRSVDLRPGGADYQGFVDDAARRLQKAGRPHDYDSAAAEAEKQISVARKFITSLAESKAKNRAIRSMGLPSGMSATDIAKPFVVLSLVQNLDASKPDEREVLLAQAAGATDALFGARREERKARNVTPPSTPPPLPEQPAQAPDERVVDYDTETGEVATYDAPPPDDGDAPPDESNGWNR